ncbi:MAG: hypothetical protein ABIU63_03890 [Chitinophagaceae bacterium]
MKSFICFACCVMGITFLQGQQFGGNPPSVRWQQVNNDAVRVIFPAALDSAAARVAAVAALLRTTTPGTIGPRQKKVDIVLHPNTIVSNGYVALGPFRSEFYLTPPQNSFELGSLRWQDMLAIHEYRHVQQYNNFNVGLSHAFRLVFGEQGQALANALAIPNWFWEGDAVFQETLVSEQGRGRLPFFFDDYRALWLAGKQYSYMKLRNGSLRDFTPDHYRLGYMLVAYGREKYGDDFWKKVTGDAAAFKGLFYPFQHAVKKYSGKTFDSFRKEAFTYFKSQSADTQQAVVTHKHFLADQEFPAYTGGDAMVYVQTSYKTLPAFIEKNGNTERRIRVKDVSNDNQFAYGKGKIIYASYRPALRWGWNDYSELQVLDVATGMQKTITRKSKYFSPGISEDGQTIVAVDVQPGAQSVLHLLNTETGKLLKALPNNENLFYTFPKFVNDKQLVAAVRKPSGEMSLALIAIADGAVDYLTEPVFRVMGNPVLQHDTIYFTVADNGYDRIFACTLADKKLYRLGVSENGIGAYQPSVSGNKIVFTSFTAAGYRLQETDRTAVDWNEVGKEQWQQPLNTFNINLSKNSAAGLLGHVQPGASPTVKKYAQTYKLFNFHSLLPYITDPDYTLSLVGNNVLNTMQSELFVAYNRNEQYKQVGTNLTYGGLFPYINLGANYTFNRRDFFAANRPVYWNEGQVSAGVSVPLNLSKGRSRINLTVGSDYVFKTVTYQGVYKDSLGSSHLGYINGYVSFTHQLQQARQHIYPRFAQSLYLNYRNTIQSVEARQFLASGLFYFPGFAMTHNLVIGLAFQTRDTLNQYRYSNSFPFSRGYETPNLRNMYKWSVNYHLPLAYPDFGIGNIVYFQRVRANAFYDYTMGKVAYTNGFRINTKFRSVGAEIFFDTKWWNELPLNLGFRYSHLLDPDLFGATGATRFEFVLPVNLFQR